MATRTALTDRQWAIASRIIPFISPHKVIPRTKAERERSLNLCKETLNNILETHQNDNSALIEDLRNLKTSIMGQTEDLRKYTEVWGKFFKNAKAIGLANPHALFEPMQIDLVAKLYEDYQSLIAIWGKISKQIPNAPVLKTGLEIRTWMNDPQNAGALGTITNLDLSKLNLRVIPQEIEKLSNLTKLDLSNNRISVIPDAIARLTNLTTLYLSYNQISVIPDAIAGLTNLTTLLLFNNRISVIPNAIAGLTNLTTLYLSYNQISVIPDAIAGLTNLTTLHLSNNRISVIPDAIARLSNLTGIFLSYNRIFVIPDAIARLTNLTTLYLSDNRISVIPDAIARLSNLRNPYLDNNRICVIERNVLSSANNSISANRLMIRFKKELSHPARYPLAILFHAIMSEKSFEEQQKLFASLSLQDQNLVFEMVYFTAKELGLDPDKDNDPIWGEHRVFDSSDIFVRAVRQTILHKFVILLPQDQKNRVYGKVYDLASDRDPSDSRWGDDHALENLPRLADAMAEC